MEGSLRECYDFIYRIESQPQFYSVDSLELTSQIRARDNKLRGSVELHVWESAIETINLGRKENRDEGVVYVVSSLIAIRSAEGFSKS